MSLFFGSLPKGSSEHPLQVTGGARKLNSLSHAVLPWPVSVPSPITVTTTSREGPSSCSLQRSPTLTAELWDGGRWARPAQWGDGWLMKVPSSQGRGENFHLLEEIKLPIFSPAHNSRRSLCGFKDLDFCRARISSVSILLQGKDDRPPTD